ncbi:tetratricopeptide repeat protein [Anaerolineae bacterium CFX7]|nr:tetratricopeptide repeat protein [Anaerolineae bacterium CFX7]
MNMGDINITGGELDSQGDMVFGGKHVHLPPQAPEWHPPKQMLNVLPTFVGRQRALQDLATLGAIGVTTPRFLIAGVGGLGKTSLAAQITHEIKSRFTGGILLAEIPTVDVFLKLGEWAELYDGDVTKIQGVNQRADRVRDIIQQRVGTKRVLAVLDGVVDESDDAKLAPLLRALRDCAVIVTSRARQLAAIPDAWLIQLEQLNDEETWQLFVRVTRNDTRLENQRAHVLEIGELVECLPMALDLAAHQLADNSSWSVAYLRGLLQDEIRQLEILHWGGDESERGIRALIRISYKRLTADEQTFLDALGAFAGIDFDAHAAAAVCETDFETARKRLAKLRRISVIQESAAPERYKLHALMRAFTRENLRAAKTDSAAQLRMATYYCDIARENGDKLDGSEIDNALAILEAEIANISAGQKWARENETREARELTRDYIAGGKTGAMTHYFSLRANWAEWIEWSEYGIAACRALDDERGEGAIVGNLGLVYADKGEWDKAIEFYQQSLVTKERVGDVQGMAQTFNNLGLVYADKGEWDKAIELYQQSLEISERLGDVVGISITEWNIGELYEKQGKLDEAIRMMERAIIVHERIGHWEAPKNRAHLQELKRKLE